MGVRPARGGVLLVALAVLGLCGRASAGDYAQDWHTIESEHFVVHYYEPLEDVARRVAVVAERAHTVLAPVLDHEPVEKTHITLVDETDGANGFASVLPRNTIRLFATAPPGLSALADHDDWLYSLTAHEYTHILHLDSIAGLPKYYNKLFGKTWAPNQIQPRWMIEGIATYEESKRTSGGRTRHAMFDMDLRMATLRGDERRLDEISHGPRAWPHGNAAYLYGSHFLKYIFDRYGDDKLREMSWEYGSNPIPWSLNRTAERVTGRTFVDLYDEWSDYRRSKYSMQSEAVERLGRREGYRRTFSGESNVNPQYTADGKSIVWSRSDGVSPGRFTVMPSGGNAGQLATFGELRRVGGFDVLSDGRMVVEQTRTQNIYNYQELHVYDPKRDTIEQITRGLRARDPSVSPDERWVAFTLGGRSERSIAVMPLRAGAKHRVVWRGDERYPQAYAPEWSPDGTRLAFTAWRDGGYKDVLIADVATGAITEVQRDRAQEIDPVFTPDGKYLLFCSDRNGIYNIYAHELSTGELFQVTNVLGAAVAPAVSPNGDRLVYQGYDAGGFELYEIPLVPERWIRAPLYVNDRPDPVTIRASEAVVTQSRPYRPLETMAPRSYTASFAANNTGQLLQISTDGGDVIGRHRYQLAGTLGLETGDLSVGGSYSYNRLWPSLRVAGNRNRNVRGGFVIDGENTRYTEETLGGTISMGFPVLRDPAATGTLSLDYDVDYLRNVGDEYDAPDPNDLLPGRPETDILLAGLAVRWSYADSRGFIHTLGPQEGKQLSLSLRLNHPALGSDFHTLNLDYRFQWWHKLPWGVTPVFAARIAGGIRTTDRDRSSPYNLGGAPGQDVVQSLLNNARSGSTGFLRGYPRREIRGQQFHLINLEYRQELFNIERGIATLPVYVRRLHLAGLADIGDAFDGTIDPRSFKASLGASLRMDVVLGYFVPGSLDIGYSRGLTDSGINEFWLLVTGTL